MPFVWDDLLGSCLYLHWRDCHWSKQCCLQAAAPKTSFNQVWIVQWHLQISCLKRHGYLPWSHFLVNILTSHVFAWHNCEWNDFPDWCSSACLLPTDSVVISAAKIILTKIPLDYQLVSHLRNNRFIHWTLLLLFIRFGNEPVLIGIWRRVCSIPSSHFLLDHFRVVYNSSSNLMMQWILWSYKRNRTICFDPSNV